MKKLFAVLVIGSLTIIGCEKPASTKAPTKPPGPSSEEKMKSAKDATEKAKPDTDKMGTPDKAKADDKKATEPKADAAKDSKAKDPKDK